MRLVYALFIALAVMGMIAGLGTFLVGKQFLLALGMITLAYASYPKVKEWITKLIND